MTPDEALLPRVLADAEEVDPSPDDEAAFAQGMANITAGHFTRCESDENLESYLDDLVARPHAS
jgi:hypothetical protein